MQQRNAINIFEDTASWAQRLSDEESAKGNEKNFATVRAYSKLKSSVETLAVEAKENKIKNESVQKCVDALTLVRPALACFPGSLIFSSFIYDVLDALEQVSPDMAKFFKQSDFFGYPEDIEGSVNTTYSPNQ